MSTDNMTQREAVQRAWAAAEGAEALAAREPQRVEGWAAVAQAWAAVAGQLEYVTGVAAGEPLPFAETQRRLVDEQLRILPTLAAMRADETIVIDERPYPAAPS